LFDDWQSAFAVIAAILIAYGVILWIGTIVWTYRDIRERTRDSWSQTVAVALVVLFNIPGLIIYLILRPSETLSEAYERRLENEAIRRDLAEQLRSCPSCSRPADEDFLLCPYCRARLREPCGSCSRPLELSWAVCPYCGSPGPQHVKAPMAVAVSPPAPAPAAPAVEPPAEAPAPAGQASPSTRSRSRARTPSRPAE
jgi:RNA polymerase subunit RPABC4/transcription elongation factor Spt4